MEKNLHLILDGLFWKCHFFLPFPSVSPLLLSCHSSSPLLFFFPWVSLSFFSIFLSALFLLLLPSLLPLISPVPLLSSFFHFHFQPLTLFILLLLLSPSLSKPPPDSSLSFTNSFHFISPLFLSFDLRPLLTFKKKKSIFSPALSLLSLFLIFIFTMCNWPLPFCDQEGPRK